MDLLNSVMFHNVLLVLVVLLLLGMIVTRWYEKNKLKIIKKYYYCKGSSLRKTHTELKLVTLKDEREYYYIGVKQNYLTYFSYGKVASEKIIGVAIRDRFGIIYGMIGKHRHAEIFIYMALQRYLVDTDIDTCGFISSHGRFLNRVEAKKIATREKQLFNNASNLKELMSEDLEHV